MKNNKTNISSLIVLFIIPCFIACYNSRTTTGEAYKYDFSSLYKPQKSSLNSECMVYHHKEKTSLLFFKQHTSELFFDIDKNGKKTAKLIVKYVLRLQESNELVDSLSTSYIINQSENGNIITSYLEINAEAGKKYDIIVLIADANKKKYRRVLIEVDKTDKTSYQNFFIEEKDDKKQPVFSRIVFSNKVYQVSYSRSNFDSLYVEYYKPINNIPNPPNVLSGSNNTIHSPDTTYYVNSIDSLVFADCGVYLLKLNSGSNNGVALVNSGVYYPDIKTVDKMIEPLRYLTTDRQIERIKNAENQKLALDEFWLSKTNDNERAKELIRIFYNRVQLSNKFFTSHTEGWQTDRGMVYIILGPPNIIYKNPESEEWIYGENPSFNVLSFMFKRRDNIFSNNDYFLIRDSEYQSMWAQAVETWRKGRAFSITTK